MKAPKSKVPPTTIPKPRMISMDVIANAIGNRKTPTMSHQEIVGYAENLSTSSVKAAIEKIGNDLLDTVLLVGSGVIVNISE